MSYISLDPASLALASLLLVASGIISLAFRLGLERGLAVAAVRMVVQLSLVALILKFVLEQGSPLYTVLFVTMMLAAAGYEVLSRQSRRIAGWQGFVIGAGPPFLSGLLASVFATTAVISTDPWHAPRYLIPILGMMLGNALSGVSLVLETMNETATRERSAIEARLSLGGTRFEALGHVLRRGMTAGLMPILTAMATTGLVALPGMMTGQILAGISPVEAAKYQIMIMFLISGATGLAVLLAGLGNVLALTDERHRLRLDRLSAKRP